MKHMMGTTFGTRLATKQRLSAVQYLEKTRAGQVKGGRFVPPKIGSKGFGHFEVDLVTPRYEVSFD